MDRQQNRSLKKIKRIKETALELFSVHGFDKVSMDEIAESAQVSKVTIYKYFGSKDDLYAEVINLWIDDTLSAAEDVLNSERDFLDKLKFMLTLQTESSALVGFDTLYQVWEDDDAIRNVQDRVKKLMQAFYDEGQQKGYIHDHVTFDTLFIYAEIFRAGIKATFLDHNLPIEKQTLDALYDAFFFGIIRQDHNPA